MKVICSLKGPPLQLAANVGGVARALRLLRRRMRASGVCSSLLA